jgi:uncharacterized protein YndB with AHSA1/START domain
MTKRSATSIVDVTKRSVHARVEIAAPPERVWKAITEEVANWWGSEATYKTTKHEVELRVGGAYRSDGVGANGPFHVSGTVVELDPPRKYVVTWQPSWTSEAPTTVTYVLEPIVDGTRLTLSHTGFTDPASCESHGEGWTRVLEWLAGYAQPKPRYWLCRLMPPRPSFMHDMTADELAVMKAHGEYWRAKLAVGMVVAFGPVAEGYGIGFVAADDEAAVRDFEINDPAIKSERGFHYEHSPMAALVF